MHNKQTTNKFLNIPVILSYYWNGSKNIITGKIKSNDYFLQFKKIESQNLIKIRYSQIDSIELMPEIAENNMQRYKALKKTAENRVLTGQYKEAISYYNRILEIIRPNTIKSNNIKSYILDCEMHLNSK